MYVGIIRRTDHEMKIIKNIFSAVIYVLIIAAVIAAVVFLISGMRLFCIQTGSMEPAYPVGSMIVVEKVGPEQLGEGDVVTYSLSGGTVVTHRVIGIDRENRLLTTKGDNNNVADVTAVGFENVIGRVIFCVPYIGYAGMLFRTKFGMIMLCVVIVGVVGTSIILRMNSRLKDKEDEEDEEETDGDNNVKARGVDRNK